MEVKKEYKVLPFETKAVDLEGSQFEGYSAGIGNRDSMDDIIQPGAFRKTIQERVAARKVKFLDGHDPQSTRNLWGNIMDAREVENPNGDIDPPTDPTHLLWTLFQVSQSDPDAQAALGKINEGILDALSIGFFAIDLDYELREELLEDSDDPEDIDPQMAWLFGLADRLIHEVAWWETSAVVWGANPAALTIPGTVKNVMLGAARASGSGREITDNEAFDTLTHMKSLMVTARENPEAMRAFNYSADGLSKALDPFINCVDGSCTLTDAGRAASYLFDGVREAVADTEEKDIVVVEVPDNEDVTEEVSKEREDDGCGCNKDAPDLSDDEGVKAAGETPTIVTLENVEAIVEKAVASALAETMGENGDVPPSVEAADSKDDDADGVDEREDEECDEVKSEDAGTTRTSADDSDKHLPTEQEQAETDALIELALLDL